MTLNLIWLGLSLVELRPWAPSAGYSAQREQATIFITKIYLYIISLFLYCCQQGKLNLDVLILSL